MVHWVGFAVGKHIEQVSILLPVYSFGLARPVRNYIVAAHWRELHALSALSVLGVRQAEPLALAKEVLRPSNIVSKVVVLFKQFFAELGPVQVKRMIATWIWEFGLGMFWLLFMLFDPLFRLKPIRTNPLNIVVRVVVAGPWN